MPKQTDDAVTRIQYLERFIKIEESVESLKCYAEMQYHFGVSERTTATYLKTLEKLGIINVDDQTIIWVER